ncbi:recombinase family protein [Rubellimicrobium rubrum]|uniref:recombinase family protein n=1 Tax=Rubellimicrobium rubrum TaxID=2585369 RepID=UPI003CCC4D5E
MLKDLQRDVMLKATEQLVDTSTVVGRAFSDMLGVFAEFEINLRRAQQMEGIAAAKRRGTYSGRKPRIDPDEVPRLQRVEKPAPRPCPNGLGSHGRRCTAFRLGARNRSINHQAPRLYERPSVEMPAQKLHCCKEGVGPVQLA